MWTVQFIYKLAYYLPTSYETVATVLERYAKFQTSRSDVKAKVR